MIKNRLKSFVWNTIYKWHVQLFQKPDVRQMKYKTAICLIFKDEAPFLREWIEYHKMIGIEHFYLYNNFSEDNYLEVLKPYIDEGFVTLKDWPYIQGQRTAYKDAWDNHKHEVNWFCFLDADEFICFKHCKNINEWLPKYAKFPSVHIYWRMFGTSGVMQHDFNKLVIEQYTNCNERLYYHGKCFVNTRYEIANWDFVGMFHYPSFHYKIFGINVKLQSISIEGHMEAPNCYWRKDGGAEVQDVQVNHYYCKAWNLYEKKMKKPSAAQKVSPKKKIAYFYIPEEKCVDRDYTIQRFLIRLHNQMEHKEYE